MSATGIKSFLGPTEGDLGHKLIIVELKLQSHEVGPFGFQHY